MSKFWSLGVMISSLFVGVLVNAYHKKEQFFPACIYLSQSNSSYTVILVFGLYLLVLFGVLTQKVFLGSLRAIEIEHLHENGWYSLTEMLLEMAIFRDEFGVLFAFLFAVHIYSKIFHWLAKDRLEYMEQTPVLDNRFHLRMTLMLAFLFAVDFWMLTFSLDKIITFGPSMMILFAFESGLLLVDIVSFGFKYLLNLIHSAAHGHWEHRPALMFYLELIENSVKLLIYLCFFFMLVNFYGLPLHIMRDMYLTFRSLVLKIRDWIQYRRATRNIEERYPFATLEELRASDQTCIICREEMVEAKKLHCGHMFHFQCLRSWLERQQTCPTCRRSVLEDPEPTVPIHSPHSEPAELGGPVPIVVINDPDWGRHTPIRLEDLEELSVDELGRIEGGLREQLVHRIQVLDKMKAQISRILDTYSRYERMLDDVNSVRQ